MNSKILAIIDANTNRLREALRVCEDIARFILSDRRITAEFKSLRHRVSRAVKKLDTKKNVLAKSRNPEKDVGKKTANDESKRKDIADIFNANMKRAEESVRVLEEFAKLCGSAPNLSNIFKRVRFRLYSLEKRTLERLQVIRNH